MVVNVVVTTSTFDITYIYILGLVVIGFLYSYLRSNEYKDTLLMSILIGAILGGFLYLIVPVGLSLILISILLVLIGGVIAVWLKKNWGSKEIEDDNEK